MILSSKKKLLHRAIIVDGYTSTGKGIICQYLQTFSNTTKMNVDHIFSEIGFLVKRNKIDINYAKELFNNRLDIYYENDFLSRDINFRPFDDSSIFKTPNKISYILKLFSKDGDEIIKNITNNKKNFLIMTHFASPFKKFFHQCLGDKLLFINVVRHPVYIFNFWTNHMLSLKEKNPRTHKFLYKKNHHDFYWYEGGGPLDPNNIYDRVIKSMLYLKRLESNQKLDEANEITLPFEKFITDTNNIENNICKNFGLSPSKYTQYFKNKNNLPEKTFTNRTMTRSRFGWKLNKEKETMELYNQKLNQIKKNASSFYFKKFKNLCEEYEDKYTFNYFS